MTDRPPNSEKRLLALREAMLSAAEESLAEAEGLLRDSRWDALRRAAAFTRAASDADRALTEQRRAEDDRLPIFAERIADAQEANL